MQAFLSVFQSQVLRLLDRLVRLPAPQAWMITLLLVDLAAFADLMTGADLWFGPLYLLIIALATWSLGWRAGQATGVGFMALTFAINGASLYPYEGTDLVWNVVLRFTAISLVIAIIAGARRIYLREWWLARTDILTGALNRQAFFDLGAALAAVSRWRLLLYVDLDGFKAINDALGHAAGDDYLRTYAAAVRRTIRREDLFARVGGDEFLVFMAVKDEAAAMRTAARLHGEMNAIPAQRGRSLRCSVGALLIPPGAVPIDALVRQADDLMYRAKQGGGALECSRAAPCGNKAADGRARAARRNPASLAVSNSKPRGDRRDPAGSPPIGRMRAPR